MGWVCRLVGVTTPHLGIIPIHDHHKRSFVCCHISPCSCPFLGLCFLIMFGLGGWTSLLHSPLNSSALPCSNRLHTCSMAVTYSPIGSHIFGMRFCMAHPRTKIKIGWSVTQGNNICPVVITSATPSSTLQWLYHLPPGNHLAPSANTFNTVVITSTTIMAITSANINIIGNNTSLVVITSATQKHGNDICHIQI